MKLETAAGAAVPAPPDLPSLDDIWSQPAAVEGDGRVRSRERRRYRIRMVGAVGACYAIDVAILGLLWLAGGTPAIVPLAYGAAGVLHVAFFATLHASGLSDRARNPHLTVWQMAWAVAMQLGAVILAPTLAPYLVGNIFVVFSFAMLRFSFRSALLAWALVCLATGVVLVQFRSVTHPFEDLGFFESAILWLGFCLTLLRVLLLGYYGSAIRVRLFKLNARLTERVDTAVDLASRDALTGALNRRAILPRVELALRNAQDGTRAGCIAMIDVDHFKAVNDRHGHLAGDAVLRELVALVRECTRETDPIGRLGGEEFLLLLPEATPADALAVVGRLREEVATRSWDHVAAGMRLTLSAGVAPLAGRLGMRDALSRADDALYQAKNSGRNRIVLHRDEMPDAPSLVA